MPDSGGAVQFGQVPNWNTPNPVGYQGPDISAPGFPVVTQDQKYAAGAPSGYRWNPVTRSYEKTPGAAGTDVNQFTTAANPALAGLLSSFGSAASGSLGGGTGGGPGGAGAAGQPGVGAGGIPNLATFGGSSGGFGGPSGGFAPPPSLQMPDASGATRAQFATAKDTAGNLARSGLESLRGELGATGNLGGGAEAQGTRDIIQSGAGLLGQAARDEAVQRSNVAADFAKTGYQGGISQRGQDIGASVAERGQNVTAAEAQARLAQEARIAAGQQQLSLLTLALGGLKGATPGYGTANSGPALPQY